MTVLDIDTRTDIYSLGVLLYELLVGALPFDRKALRRTPARELPRLLRHEDPVTPSTSRRSDAPTALVCGGSYAAISTGSR